MPIDPVRPRSDHSFSKLAQLVVAVARRLGAEEQFERERRLADQHLEPVHRLQLARARACASSAGLERRIDRMS